MKNENAKLDFINSLLGIVESCASVTHKVPSKVYFNFPSPHFDIFDQKAVLAELKKKKVIASFKLDDGDFVISKPSRSTLRDYYLTIKDRPEPKTERPVDTRIKFDMKTGIINIGGKLCEIPINTNQYFLCKILFAVPFGTPVTETDIVDMIDWAKETKRSVYDAMSAVNKRIKSDLGIDKFIKWKTGRVRIDYERK